MPELSTGLPACRFTELRLGQFRSYTTARLELDGRPVTLIGPNGSGKTGILEAASLFSPGRGLRRAAPADLACRRHGAEWQVAARLVEDGLERQLVTRYQGTAGRRVEIEGKASRQLDLGKLVRIVWFVPAMDRLWTDGGDGRRKFLDRMAMGFFPAHAEHVINYEKSMRERNRLIRDGRRIEGWLDAIERQMAEYGASISAGRQRAVDMLQSAASQAVEGFPAARLEMTAPEGSCGNSTDVEEIAEALARGRNRDFAAGRTLTGPHRADLLAVHDVRGMEASNCSTGEQKALLLSIILANARAIKEFCGGPPVLLFDEVAAHLDADRRDALFAEICRLNVQAWLTGTQADYFASLGQETQWFKVSETDGQSAVAEAVAP